MRPCARLHVIELRYYECPRTNATGNDRRKSCSVLQSERGKNDKRKKDFRTRLKNYFGILIFGTRVTQKPPLSSAFRATNVESLIILRSHRKCSRSVFARISPRSSSVPNHETSHARWECNPSCARNQLRVVRAGVAVVEFTRLTPIGNLRHNTTLNVSSR